MEPGKDRSEKVVIVGAGIAGMTAALYLLKAGFDVTIIEKSNHVGGKFGATRGKHNEPHEHAYHFLGDWCVNFWTVATQIGLTRNRDFRQSKGVRFLRPYDGRRLPDRLSTLALDQLPSRFTESLYSGVLPPDDMLIWFYSLLELVTHGRDLDEKEFLNRISVNGFMRWLPYMTDRAALLHQEALMKAFAIPSYETSARSYRRLARFLSRDQDGWILTKPVDEGFWCQFLKALQKCRRGESPANDAYWPVQRNTALEEVKVEREGRRLAHVCGLRVAEQGKSEPWDEFGSLLITVPPGDLVSIVEQSPSLRCAAPGLLDLRKLKSKQMASLDVYFRRPLADIPSEHVTLIDGDWITMPQDRKERLGTYGNRMASRFALSFVDNYQAWKGNPRQETWLNVVAADFEPLAGLREEEAKQAMLDELGKYLVFDPADIDHQRSTLQPNAEAPLFMNTVGSWQHRPPAGRYTDGQSKVLVDNLYLAGDYCQSQVDVVSLEGAVMTARLAACDIAKHAPGKRDVPDAEVPAEVGDRKINLLKEDLKPWLRLAANGSFGASQRLRELGLA
jgi:Flavin containing amine oxidoreductase